MRAGSRPSLFTETYPLQGLKIDWTGASDSSTAVQSFIDSTPPGSCIELGRGGVLRIDQPVIISEGRALRGSGWRMKRDKTGGFGTANWADDTHFGGCVIRSNLTTGNIFTVTDSQVTQGALSGFILIGPGTGASTGIHVGRGENVGDQPFINGNLHDVMVANFDTGWDLVHVEESRIGIAARGCNRGIDMRDATNNNDISLMNTQWCGTGLDMDNTCTANTFTQFIGQNNLGTSARIVGTANIFNGAYFENSQGVESIRIVGGHLNQVNSAVLTKPTDRIVIEGNARSTTVRAPVSFELAEIEDNGFGTTLFVDQSRTPVVGTPQRRLLIDPANQTYPWSA